MTTPPSKDPYGPRGSIPAGSDPVPGGTTFGAPDAVAVSDVQRGKMPTKKLIAITATAVAIAVARIVLEALGLEMDDDLEQLINAIVPLIVGYLTPNDLTPGGVPDAKPKVLDLTKEDGYGLVEVAIFLLIVVIAIAVLVRFV